MRLIAILSPIGDPAQVLDAARAADDAGLDGVGLWDHYHSGRPEWGYVAGWAMLGAIAAVTKHVRIVPMVLNSLHYELGVLAKESSVLALATGGRFDLGIGAGDWPESFEAWGMPYPAAPDRLDLLEEKVRALRELWRGEPVTASGRHIQLAAATCTPAPAAPPRVVVGVGGSLAALSRAVSFADEVNVYARPDLVQRARELAAGAPSQPSVSAFVDWSWQQWPESLASALESIGDVERTYVALAGPNLIERIELLAEAAT